MPIKIKIEGKEELEKKFNGLVVILNVLELDGKGCEDCDDDNRTALTREFEIARVWRGAVPLRSKTAFSRELERFVLDNMGHSRSLCLNCFELLAEKNLGGFEPAD